MHRTCLIALLLLAPIASAQVSAAQAVKEAQAASKAALATFKTSVSDARAAYLADIATVEGKFKGGTGVVADLDDLFASTTTLQAAFRPGSRSPTSRLPTA